MNHVPGDNREFEDGAYHYNRNDRHQLPNSPQRRRNKTGTRFLILIIDLALVFGVALCLKNSGKLDFLGEDTSSRKILDEEKVRVSRFVQGKLYTLQGIPGPNMLELRLSIRKSNHQAFPFPDDLQIVFQLSNKAGLLNLPASPPAYTNPSPVFVYHARTRNTNMMPATLGARVRKVSNSTHHYLFSIPATDK